MTLSAPKTLIDALQESFTGALRSPDGTAAPVALLWTDADGQWRPLIATLMKAIPELYALGPFAPEEREGPVIWLKCIIERSLPDALPPPGVVPILYLPDVSRQDLRAGGHCPADLQPLIELQYRGAVWHQRNGRDWTVDAFLTSEDGVGLDIAKDNRTRDAMLRALALLAPEPLVGLRGHRLEADDFDRLAIGDPVRDLLGWMSDNEAFEARCDPNRWATFKDICWREFSLDPDEDGTQGAADALLHGGGKWDEVWRRFCDAPRLYQGVSAVLRQARPRDLLGLADHSRRPGLTRSKRTDSARNSRPSLPCRTRRPAIRSTNWTMSTGSAEFGFGRNLARAPTRWPLSRLAGWQRRPRPHSVAPRRKPWLPTMHPRAGGATARRWTRSAA